NSTMFNEIFRRDPVTGGGQYFRSLSGALLSAKLGATQTTQKYQVMGDAALRLNLPRDWTDITLWDSAGTTPVTNLTTGQVITYKGRVLDQPGGTLLPFSGSATLEIDDAQQLEVTPDCPFSPGCQPALYYYAPGVMFHGTVGVQAGLFEGKLTVPIDAAAGGRGRVRAYLDGSTSAPAGAEDGVGSIMVTVTPGAAPTWDQDGPRITLSFNGGATVVRPTADLHVDLFDASGILTTGHNLQNGIIVTLDQNTTLRTDITPSFRYAANSHQSGTASYTLPGLTTGPHTIEVSAADNLASGLNAGVHRSRTSLSFQVEESPSLSISRAYLFPDPTCSGGVSCGGRFVVDSPGDSVNVLLRVYTVAGRLVRTLRSYGSVGQSQIPWDGLDEEGDPLANGVYLFKVHVYGRQEDGSSSATERAVADGRLVIVNR
ncbi:MAG: FlgD immunoglobulin-like domain containing protein, partial [Candidatus Eiseniibacteriota bacterium]